MHSASAFSNFQRVNSIWSERVTRRARRSARLRRLWAELRPRFRNLCIESEPHSAGAFKCDCPRRGTRMVDASSPESPRRAEELSDKMLEHCLTDAEHAELMQLV